MATNCSEHSCSPKAGNEHYSARGAAVFLETNGPASPVRLRSFSAVRAADLGSTGNHRADET
eukprot:6173761-Pleurochrysis_carterae.AAC.3